MLRIDRNEKKRKHFSLMHENNEFRYHKEINGTIFWACKVAGCPGMLEEQNYKVRTIREHVHKSHVNDRRAKKWQTNPWYHTQSEDKYNHDPIEAYNINNSMKMSRDPVQPVDKPLPPTPRENEENMTPRYFYFDMPAKSHTKSAIPSVTTGQLPGGPKRERLDFGNDLSESSDSLRSVIECNDYRQRRFWVIMGIITLIALITVAVTLSLYFIDKSRLNEQLPKRGDDVVPQTTTDVQSTIARADEALSQITTTAINGAQQVPTQGASTSVSTLQAIVRDTKVSTDPNVAAPTVESSLSSSTTTQKTSSASSTTKTISTTTVQTSSLSTAPMVFSGSLILNRTWTAALSDDTTPQYKILSRAIEYELDTAFLTSPLKSLFNESQVTEFSSGSVRVFFKIVFRVTVMLDGQVDTSSVNVTDVRQTIEDEARRQQTTRTNGYLSTVMAGSISVKLANAPVVLMGDLFLNEAWNDSLNDPTSPISRKLTAQLKAELQATLLKLTENDFLDVEILGFRPGSIEVVFRIVMTINSTQNQSQIDVSTIIQAIQNEANRQLQQAVSGLLQKLITLTVDNQTLANATSSSVTSITPTVAATNLATTTDFATASTSSTQSTGTKEVATTFEPTTTIEASATMTTQQTTSFNAETTTVPVKSTSKPTISTESIKTTFQLEISSFKLETSTDLITATTVPVSSSSKPSVLTESITTFQPATTSLKLETSSVVITTTTVSVTSSFKPNISTKLITTTTQLASTVTTQSSASTLEATASSKSATTVIEPTEATIQPGTTSFQPKTSFSEAIISSTQPASITSTPTIIYSKSIATTLQQATTSLKPTTFSEVNTISSQSARTSFKQESMTEATKTTIQPATTTMEAIKSSKPAATLIESIIMITQPAESTSYPTTLNVTITTTTHLSITPTIQPATTREAIISFKSATTSTESEPSTFSEPKTSFEVIEITSHLATTSTGRLFTTQQALTTSKASAFTQLMSIFDATTGIYPKSTTEGIQTIQSSITTAYTYISFTLERTINETAIISLPVTTTSQSVFKANETVSITQPETITAKSPISSQIETTIIQPTASFITPSSTQLDVITVGTSAILQSIISTIEANFTQPRPTEKITPTLLVATTSLPTQYTPTPLPTSKQYTTSSLPTSTQYTTSPLPTSTQYTATPLPTSTQYSTTPLPTSTQYTTSMTTAATPDVCQDKTSIVANGWVCVLPYYSTITTEVDVDMFCKVIRDVLNCTVSNVEKELNISCPSNSLKTVASVYSPLLRDSIKMKHDPVECNLEPLNEICFSQEIFETSEFQQCFKTFNLLSDLPNSMEKEERCRIYTHSLRCVGENIADCDAGNIHKLINSSSLEITGRNSSVYDLKCSDLEPSQSFCDDKEALLLHIYGKCYINLLILSRTSCITVDSLMDCAYNQTGELYFNCSKTSIRSSLNNASSFYERKFPGYGQQIATCIQITDTNCSIAVQDIYSHPEAQKCLGIYLLLLLTNGSAALSDKTQCYTYQSVVHCVKDRLASCTVQDFDSLLRPLVAGVYKQKISPLCQVNDVLAPACTIESVIIDNADIYCKSPLAVLQASCSLTSVSMYVGCISSTMSMFNNTCTEDEVRSAMINATNYFEKLFPGEGLNISKCIETQEKGNCTVDKEFFSTPGYIRCIAPFHYGMTSGRGGNLTETKCRTYQRSLECTSKLNPACSLKDYDAMISLYYKSLETPLLDPSDCPMNRSLPNFCTSTNEIMYIVSVFCRDHFEWIRDFCPHSIDNFMECVANWTSRTAYECDENIIMEVISNDQMFYNSILPGSGSAITACISQFLSKRRVKRLAFTIKMMSGFFWDDSLLNPDSSYFQDLSKIIAGNFEKTFGAVPGFLNISVSSFRKDTKYLDMALRYDSSMLSGVDFMDAIQLAVQNRTIDQLQVENYFLYRGELKDGECPTLQSKGDCLEECQMDSNCTGSEKCCYNGCGYTCQKPVSGIHPCEDYELLGQSGEQCSGALAQNLTSASNREQFCLVSEKFLNCVYEGILKETNVQCSKDQLITALKTFGPVMKSVMNLQSNPAECYEDLTSQMSTTLEFTTPQTLTDSSTTPQSVLLRYCRDSNTIISKGWRCVVPAVMNITTAKNFAEFCSFVDMVYICIMDGVAAEYNLTCRQSDKEFAIHLFSPMFKTAFNLEYNPGSCFAHETTISTFSWISTQFTTSLPSIATTIATMTTPTTPSPLLAKCSDTDVILSKTLQCVLPNFANITAAMDEVEFCRIVDLIFVCIMTEIGSEFSVLCRENDKEVAIEFYGPTLQSELSLNSNPVNCYLKTSSTVTTPLTSLSSAEPIMTTTESVQSTTEEFSSTTTTSQKFESTEMTTQPSKMSPTTVTQSPFSGKCRDNQEVLSKGWQCALPLFVNVTTAGNLLMFCSSFEMIFDCIMDGIELDYGVNCTEEDRNNITFFYAPNLQSAMALKYDPKECFLLKQTTVSPGSSMRPITTESPLLAVCEDSDTILAVGWICALPLYMNISRETDMSVFCSLAESVFICILDKIGTKSGVQCTDSHKAIVIRKYSESLQSISTQSFNPTQCYVMTSTTEGITSVPPYTTTDNPLLAKCQDSASITSAAYICVLSLYNNITTAENNSTFCSIMDVAFSCIMKTIETNHNISCPAGDKEIMITSYGPDLKINLNLRFDPTDCYTSERVVRATRVRRSLVSPCQDSVTLFSKGIYCMAPLYNNISNENSSFQRFCSVFEDFAVCVMGEMAAEHNVTCGQLEYNTFVKTHSSSMHKTMGLAFKPLDCLMMSSTTEGPNTTSTIETTTPPFNSCLDPDSTFINLMPCIGPVFLSLKTESNFTVFCGLTSNIFECLINKLESSLNTTCSGTDAARTAQVYGSTIQNKLSLTYNPVLCYKNKSESESSLTLQPSVLITASPLIRSSVPSISKTEASFIKPTSTFLSSVSTKASLLIESTAFTTVSPLVDSSLLPQSESISTSPLTESSSALIPSKSTAYPFTESSAVFSMTTETSTFQTTAEPRPCQDLNKVTLHVLSCAGPIIFSLHSAKNPEEFCRLFIQVFDCIVNKTETASNISCSSNDKEMIVQTIGSQILSSLLISYDPNICYETTTISTTSSTPTEITATTTTEPKHCRKSSQINSEILPCLGPLFPSITSAQNLQVFCRLMVDMFSCIINNVAFDGNISCSEFDRLHIVRTFAPELDQTIASPFKIMECTELFGGTTTTSYQNVTLLTPTSPSPSTGLTDSTTQSFSTTSRHTTSATGSQCRRKSEIFTQGIHCIGPLYRNFSTETQFPDFCRLLHSVFQCILGRIEAKYNTTCSTSDLMAVKLLYETEIYKSIPLNFDPDECPDNTNCFEVLVDERYPKCFKTFSLYEKFKSQVYNLKLSASETCSLYRGSLRCIGNYHRSCSIEDTHSVISHSLVALNSTINPSTCSVNGTYPKSVCEDDEFSLLVIHADCGFHSILIPFDCQRHMMDFITCAAKSLSFLNCNIDSFWRALTVLSSSNASFFDRINSGRGNDVVACINQLKVSMTTPAVPMTTEPPEEVSKLSFSIVLSGVEWNTTLLNMTSEYYRIVTGYIDGNVTVIFGSDPAFLQIEVISYRKNVDNLTKVDLEITYNSTIHVAQDVYEQLKRLTNSGLIYNLSVTSFLMFDENTRNSSCPTVTSVSTSCHDGCVKDTDCSTNEKCCSNGCGRICQNSTDFRSSYDLRYLEFPILQQNAEQMLVSVTLPDYKWTVELLDPNSSVYREIKKAVVTNFEEQMKSSTEFIGFHVSSLRNGPYVIADVIVTYNKNRISSSSVVNVLFMLSGHGFIHQMKIETDLQFDKKVKPGVCPQLSMAVYRTCLDTCTGDTSCSGKRKCCFNGCARSCIDPGYVGVSTTETTTDSDTTVTMEASTQVTTTHSPTGTVPQQPTPLPPSGQQMTITIELEKYSWSDELLLNMSSYYQELRRIVMKSFQEQFSGMQAFLGVEVKSFRSGGVFVDLVLSYDRALTDAASLVNTIFLLLNHGYIHQLHVTNYLRYDYVVKAGTCPLVTTVGSCTEQCTGDSRCPGVRKCCSNGCGQMCTDVWMPVSSSTTTDKPSVQITTTRTTMPANVGVLSVTMELQDYKWDPSLLDHRSSYYLQLETAIKTSVLQLFSQSKAIVDVQITSFRSKQNRVDLVILYNADNAVLMDLITKMIQAREKQAVHDLKITSYMTFDTQLKEGTCSPASVGGSCFEDCMGDGTCPGVEKCCSTGCGRLCTPAIQIP